MDTIYIWRAKTAYNQSIRVVCPGRETIENFGRDNVAEGSLAFSKPKRPTISPKGFDGYRMPTAYAAGTSNTLGVGTLVPIPEVEERYGCQFIYSDNGTILIECASANPSTLLKQASSFNNVNHLRTKILNNISDEVLDVSMVLAEMQSTVNTATTMLNRIGRSMIAFKRRKPESFYYLLNGKRRDNRRPTDKFLRQTAGEYLQWKYGIMPSVYDLEGALRGLDINEKGSLFDNPPLMTARARIRESEKRNLTGSSGWHFPIKGLVFDTVVEAKARCDFSVKAEGLRGLNRYGIGLMSLPTVLWDKTPFTFVLDMAVPIASLIKAWGALSGVDVRSYCETFYASSSASGTTDYPFLKIEYAFPEVSTFKREVYGSPPMPLPFIKNPIKTGNLATVLALFTSLRKG